MRNFLEIAGWGVAAFQELRDVAGWDGESDKAGRNGEPGGVGELFGALRSEGPA